MSEKRFSDLNDLQAIIEELEQEIDEQQATIRRLQDLCGESDGENAKLRIENKRLQEENEQLRKERILLEYQLKVQDRIIEEYEGG